VYSVVKYTIYRVLAKYLNTSHLAFVITLAAYCKSQHNTLCVMTSSPVSFSRVSFVLLLLLLMMMMMMMYWYFEQINITDMGSGIRRTDGNFHKNLENLHEYQQSTQTLHRQKLDSAIYTFSCSLGLSLFKL